MLGKLERRDSYTYSAVGLPVKVFKRYAYISSVTLRLLDGKFEKFIGLCCCCCCCLIFSQRLGSTNAKLRKLPVALPDVMT